MKSFLRPLASFTLFAALSVFLHAEEKAPFKVGGDTLKCDKSGLRYHDGITPLSSVPPNNPNPYAEINGWAEYNFTVPADGWYNLYFQDLPGGTRETFVDGQRVVLEGGDGGSAAGYLGIKTAPDTGIEKGWTKEVNMPLKAGNHVFRLERVGRMAASWPRAWEVRAASPNPSDRISVQRKGFNVIRVGEDLTLAVTGGGDDLPATYEIVQFDGVTKEAKSVATVTFPATERFQTKTVDIPATAEGAFFLFAKVKDQYLDEVDFRAGSYVAIDTKGAPSVPLSQEAPKTLVHDIDCVANTIDGKPVTLNQDYWEANGATRVSTSPAGTYRESGNGLGPDTDPHPAAPWNNFSGFTYLVDVPVPGKRYQIEIEHPDDDWRSVCVPVTDILDPVTKKEYTPPTFAYQTGGTLPLSNKMLTERYLFYPNGKQLNLGLVSSRIGHRAAAAHIRIYTLDGPLPAITKRGDGRYVGIWTEEIERWNTHFNTPRDLPYLVRDYLGLQRESEWAAYTGANGLWPTATAYQEATYDSQAMKGFLIKSYDTTRIGALLCEKYHMAFTAEIFPARQAYFDQITIPLGAENPKDIYDTTWTGFSVGNDPSKEGLLWASFNILHPHIQQKMLDIYGELADSLAGCPAFAGVSGRDDVWLWNGLYAITDLNYGYGDWTIGQFEKETGIKVPGAMDDPKRFETRYHFLTSAEMKPKWVAWRASRVTDFLHRLSQRVREHNPNVTFYLCGNGKMDEPFGASLPTDLRQRLIEAGVDVAALDKEGGIAIAPTATYGLGKSWSYLDDQKGYDDFLDPDYQAAGHNRLSATAFGTAYQEWGTAFPFDKIGVGPGNAYCSGSDAAGENAMEKFSDVLADQDTMAIRDGGYPVIQGRRDFYARWMAEFSQLPRRPFTPVEFARDPVAVWQRQDEDGFLFYAVNRERYPVKITLTLSGASKVTRLGTGETLPLKEGKLELDLAPYELRSFKASDSASITDAETITPPEQIAYVQQRLSFAQNIADEMEGAALQSTFTDDERKTFHDRLQLAWDAYAAHHYWRTRTLLSSAPMMAAYEKTGEYPPGQVACHFPNLLAYSSTNIFLPGNTFFDADTLFPNVTPESQATLVDSATYNPQWAFTKVISSAGGELDLDLDVPGTGIYQLVLGHVSPQTGVMTVSLGGQSLAAPAVTKAPGDPEKTVFPAIRLNSGKVRLSIRRPDSFGIYAVQLSPKLQPINTTLWSTVGPFKSFFHSGMGLGADAAVKQGMDKVYPPEKNPDLGAVYTDDLGNPATQLRWGQTDRIIGNHEEAGVNFAIRNQILFNDFGFAQTTITSPDERDVSVSIGTDWWTNAWMNGEQVTLDVPKLSTATDCYFNGWTPHLAMVHLKKGVNVLLVKCQGGDLQDWFTCYISDPGDLTFSAKP